MLSADFALGASGMMLSGFEAGGETLSISQVESEYRFTLSQGQWNAVDPGLAGVHAEGQTLMVETSIFDSQFDSGAGWLTVAGSGESSLGVEFGEFSLASSLGGVQLVGVTSLSQAPGTQLALGSSMLNVAAPATGVTVSSLNVIGNLNILSLGPIVDGPDTRITVSGDATFISRAFSPESDFNEDGVVNTGDYDIWKANFGATSATKAMGDANLDTVVDAADYTLWRDSLGAVREPGGITLADNAGDLLSVGGRATFEAIDGTDRFDINVGAGGRTYFGSLAVLGENVQVVEDSATVLDTIDAESFTLDSFGSITDSVGASILVTQDIGLRTQSAVLEADFDNSGAVDGLDLTIWQTNDGLASGATRAQGDANGDGAVNGFDLLILQATTGEAVAPSVITLSDNAADTLSVGGRGMLQAGNPTTRFDVTVGPAGTSNFGYLDLFGANVKLQEDSASHIGAVDATTLDLTSAGAITDSSVIVVAGNATFAAAGPITINELLGDILNVGGLAFFNAPTFAIQVGSAGSANMGQLRFNGAAVTIQEDSATQLAGVSNAQSLSLNSGGDITDAAGANVSVTADGTFVSGGTITLGDNATDVLSVGMAASFTAVGRINLGPAGTSNFGSLSLAGSTATVQEDSDTVLHNVNVANLSLTSAGSITDGPSASIVATVGATFNAATGITLSDGALDVLTVGADAVFSSPLAAIAVGPAGAANFGRLRLVGADVTIQEDSATVLFGASTASSLGLTSAGAITDAAGASVAVTGNATLTAGGAITLADTAADTLSVGGLAAFAAPGFDINLGPTGTVNFGQLRFQGANVTIQEDSETELAGASTAAGLALNSAGSITDAAGANLSVSGVATFTSGASITLADNAADVLSVGGLASFNATSNINLGPAGAANFGQLALSGVDATVQEDSATVLATIAVTNLDLTSAGSITGGPSIVATGNATLNAGGFILLNDVATHVFTVGGLASFNAPAFTINIGSAGTANFGRVRFTGDAVTIQEDSGTLLSDASSASVFNLDSAGAIGTFGAASLNVTGNSIITAAGGITDGFGASLTVGGAATFNAGGAILLGDAAADVLSVGALATFNAPGFTITVGPAGTTNFGMLRFLGTTVAIQEDSATELTSTSSASTLNLTSAGAITDSASANVSVTGAATLTSGASITLAEGVGNALTVGGLATFAATGDINLGPGGTANFGQLALSGVNATVQEDSDTVLTTVAVTNLNLTSSGSITDASNIVITGAGTFNAGGVITLNDLPGDVLTVGGLAFFNAPGFAVSIGPAGSANFGQLRFVGSTVTLQEDSATELAGASTATTLNLTSAGAIGTAPAATLNVTGAATLSAAAGITDGPGAALTFGGNATLNAGGAIELGEIAADTLSVTNLAFFNAPGFAISVGTAGTANFGQLRFVGAAVAIQEDSATELAGSSNALSLDLESTGALTDAATATLTVSQDALVQAGGKITLADAGVANSLIVLGLGRFEVTDGNDIDLGVVPATGLPAAAHAQLGTLSFRALGGDVRVALDTPIVFSGISAAEGGEFAAAGAITDEPGANTTLTGSGVLQAAVGSDIVLGEDTVLPTRFSMTTLAGTLAPFDATRFLALRANNVSIQADSGVNLRTGATDQAFTGTFYLSAEGTIAQVADSANTLTPLTAQRVVLNSERAVLFRSIELTTAVTVDGSTAPNLSLTGGVAEPITILPATFPLTAIPSSSITPFSPIGIVPDRVPAPRPDSSGLDDLAGTRVMEPSAIGDGYAVVAVVQGDAKIGAVADATGVQATRVGVQVNKAESNAFVQTQATVGAAAETGQLVFSSVGAPGTEAVVQMLGGVFTALAAGQLVIDTDKPSEAAGLRTTKLVSATGAVTNVEDYQSPEGTGAGAPRDLRGPRLVLDPQRELSNAATSGLIFSEDGLISGKPFEQRITLVAGSRGEDNLVLELEWADVANPRLGGAALDGTVDGTQPFADVTLAPQGIEGGAINPGLEQATTPPLDFRALTVVHNYDPAFIPSNPRVQFLPTAVRLYNDPAINLFESVKIEADGAATFVDLNFADNFVQPRVIGPTGGYFEFSAVEQPTVFAVRDLPPVAANVSTPLSRSNVESVRGVTRGSAEVLLFGRIDEETGEWADDIPGESWPQKWEGETPEGEPDQADALAKIRAKIDGGPAPEGRYRISSSTARGDQPLDEWVKGDRKAEARVEYDPAPAAEAAQPEASSEGSELPAPAESVPSNSAPENPERDPGASVLPAERGVLPLGNTTAIGAALAVSRWNALFAWGGGADVQGENGGFSRADRRRRQRGRLQ